jgi:hypothetical protein
MAGGGGSAPLKPSVPVSAVTGLGACSFAALPLVFLAALPALALFDFFGLTSLADLPPADAVALPDAVPGVFAAVVLAAPLFARAAGDLAVPVLDAAVVRAFAVLADFAAGVFAAVAEVLRRAVVAALRAVAGLAAVLLLDAEADMALAASDSDFTAVSIAFDALLMARSAVVIVLAESVAWAAAVFSFAAAFVTFVAADETARGVLAAAVVAVARRVVVFAAVRVPVVARVVRPVPVPRFAVRPVAPARVAGARVPVPRALVLRVPVLRVPVLRVPVARLDVADVVRDAVVFAVLVRLALAPWRAGFAAALSVGTDLPLSRSVTGVLIPRSVMFYTW